MTNQEPSWPGDMYADEPQKETSTYRGYLPIECPRCDRVRLELWSDLGDSGNLLNTHIVCEKCGYSEDDVTNGTEESKK